MRFLFVGPHLCARASSSGWASLLTAMCALLTIVMAAMPVVAQSTTPPPIIDRELFFGDPEIAGAQISPDGVFIAFIKPFKGTRNIWVKRTAEPFASAKEPLNKYQKWLYSVYTNRLQTETRPLSPFFIAHGAMFAPFGVL